MSKFSMFRRGLGILAAMAVCVSAGSRAEAGLMVSFSQVGGSPPTTYTVNDNDTGNVNPLKNDGNPAVGKMVLTGVFGDWTVNVIFTNSNAASLTNPSTLGATINVSRTGGPTTDPGYARRLIVTVSDDSFTTPTLLPLTATGVGTNSNTIGADASQLVFNSFIKSGVTTTVINPVTTLGNNEQTTDPANTGITIPVTPFTMTMVFDIGLAPKGLAHSSATSGTLSLLHAIVPEPSSLLVWSLGGVIGLIALRRRRVVG